MWQILPSKDGDVTPEKNAWITTNAVLRQNSVCFRSSLSMRSFAIDEHCLPACALYATLDQTTSDVLVYNVELHYKYDHSYFASIQAGLLEKNLKTHSAENRLRATDVNLHQFPFWSSLKLTQRRKSTKATNGILHLFRQVIWQTGWL